MKSDLHRYNVQLTYQFSCGVADKQQVGFCAFVLFLHKRPVEVVEELHATSEHCHTRELSLWEGERSCKVAAFYSVVYNCADGVKTQMTDLVAKQEQNPVVRDEFDVQFKASFRTLWVRCDFSVACPVEVRRIFYPLLGYCWLRSITKHPDTHALSYTTT